MKKLMTMQIPAALEGVTGWLLGHWGDAVLRLIK